MYFHQMKKGLLVYRINRNDQSNIGVINKCKAQVKAFRQQGIPVDILWLSKKGVLLNEDLIFPFDLPPHSLKIYLFYFFKFGSIIKLITFKSKYDFIYLRHPFFDPLLFFTLKSLKNKKPSLKIILEINTFPYDQEPKRFLHKFSLFLDKTLRRKVNLFLDRIVHYGLEKEIWGIPTINIKNGVSLKRSQVKRNNSNSKTIKMIAVGNWSYWHGLDRLIQGIKKFYEKKRGRRVQLTIVGDGAEKSNLLALVAKNNLSECINFMPALFGEELDQVLSHADLGIGTLGIHRKSVSIDSSLKHREYCSAGLPFILSSPDLDFPENLDFVHYVPINDNPININKILDWYLSINSTAHIKKFAEENLSWEVQLGPVFQYILS